MTKHNDSILKCIRALSMKCEQRQGAMKFISLLASEIKVPYVCTEAHTKEEFTRFKELIDIEGMRNDVDNHICYAFATLGLVSPASDEKLDRISLNMANTVSSKFKIPILLPPYSSQFIIPTFKTIGANAIYACIEPDLLLYRTAITNCHLYGIKHMIVNTEKEYLPMDAKEWEFANMWIPPHKESKLFDEYDDKEYN